MKEEKFDTTSFDLTGKTTFRAIGDAMDNGLYKSISNGDSVTCTEIAPENWSGELAKNKNTVIKIKGEGLFIAKVDGYKPEDQTVTLTFLNPEAEPFSFPYSDITQVFRVDWISRMEADLEELENLYPDIEE